MRDDMETRDISEIAEFSGPTSNSLSETTFRLWYADFANYAAYDIIPKRLTHQQKRRFLSEAREYYWDTPDLFKCDGDQIIRRCVAEPKQPTILEACHS